MSLRYDALRFRQCTRPRITVRKLASIFQCAPKQRTIRVSVRAAEKRAQADDAFAIGLDQRNVDAVHRRAAHQADAAEEPHS
jgi:hypothetical protein